MVTMKKIPTSVPVNAIEDFKYTTATDVTAVAAVEKKRIQKKRQKTKRKMEYTTNQHCCEELLWINRMGWDQANGK